MNEKPGMNEKKNTRHLLDEINLILPRVNENADTFSPVCLLVSSLQLFGKSAAFSAGATRRHTALGEDPIRRQSIDAVLISGKKNPI